MQKYDVHLFPVVRFTVRGVEAESMEDACKKADQLLSDETIKTAIAGGSEHEADFADEVIEALVDVQSNEDYSESTWLKPDGDDGKNTRKPKVDVTAREPTMDPLKAQYVKFIEVTDPDTGAEVELEVYKDPESGAMFAIDSTFLEQVRQIIPSPFNPGNDLLCEGGE